MQKFKIHFDEEFCQQTVDLGISRKLIIERLKILRLNPEVGEPVSSKFPTYRVFRGPIGNYGDFDIGYAYAKGLRDIDVSFIHKADDDDPKPPKSWRDVVADLIYVTRFVAMIIKLIKELLSLST